MMGDEWRLITKASLDREVRDKHTLKIIATDGKFQTAATAEIHVLDINDNSPLCEHVSDSKFQHTIISMKRIIITNAKLLVR